jgi:chaperonin GroES
LTRTTRIPDTRTGPPRRRRTDFPGSAPPDGYHKAADGTATGVTKQPKTQPLPQVAEIEPSMATKITPLGKRVLVQRTEEEEKSTGGIIIPDTAKEKPQQGKVIAVGTGKLDEKGNKIPFNVKKGDKVLMPKYGGSEIKLDGKEYQIMREEDILGILAD